MPCFLTQHNVHLHKYYNGFLSACLGVLRIIFQKYLSGILSLHFQHRKVYRTKHTNKIKHINNKINHIDRAYK